MSSVPAPVAAPAAPSMSAPSRMLAVLYAPTQAFASLKDRTRWYSFFAPWLVVAVVFALFGFVVDKKVGYATVYENQMRTMPKIQQIIDQQPPAQKAQALQKGVARARSQGYTGGLWLVIMNLIFAAVLLATFNFGAGAQLNFKTSLAVVTYSYMPMAVKMLLACVLVWAGAVVSDGFLMQNPIATNAAFLIDPAAHPALSMFLMTFDVFAIWMLAVAAIGFAAVSRLKRATTAIIVFGWYVLWALLWTGVAALFF